MRAARTATNRAPAKDAVRRALALVAGLTVQDMARRLGVSLSLLTAVRDPRTSHRLDAERMRQLAGLLRGEAGRLLAAAEELEQRAEGA